MGLLCIWSSCWHRTEGPFFAPFDEVLCVAMVETWRVCGCMQGRERHHGAHNALHLPLLHDGAHDTGAGMSHSLPVAWKRIEVLTLLCTSALSQ